MFNTKTTKENNTTAEEENYIIPKNSYYGYLIEKREKQQARNKIVIDEETINNDELFEIKYNTGFYIDSTSREMVIKAVKKFRGKEEITKYDLDDFMVNFINDTEASYDWKSTIIEDLELYLSYTD